jgi:hypothetical protein
VEERRFLNQYQPQTLVMGTMLCYLEAVFGFLFGMVAFSRLFVLITLVGLVAGGFGIANEKKWGYTVAVASSILQLAMLVLVLGSHVLDFGWVITLMFDVALVALLLHPQSREYQKIWFK